MESQYGTAQYERDGDGTERTETGRRWDGTEGEKGWNHLVQDSFSLSCEIHVVAAGSLRSLDES